MRVGICLNDVVREHFKSIIDTYELYTRELNEGFTIETTSPPDEDDKNYIESICNVDGNKIESLEPKILKKYEISSDDISESIEEWGFSEVSDKVERSLIEVDGVDDPMDITKSLKFLDKHEFEEFMYHEHPFEIFARSPLTYPEAMQDLNALYALLVKLGDTATIISQERGNSTCATLLFLSQNQCRANNYKFLWDYSKVWDLFDVIITADPFIIKAKPDNLKTYKLCLKIETEGNKDITGKGIHSFTKISDIVKTYKKRL